MTIDLDPAKQFAIKAVKTARRLAKEYVQPSARTTADGITFTLHVRLRRKGRPLPTT